MSRRRLSRVMAAVAMVAAPMVAMAAEEDVLKRIDALSREIEQLKAQVRANDDKVTKADAETKAQAKRAEERSLERWLTVGGDYRFRIDALRGETVPFTDAATTFANAQNKLQSDFFGNPTGLSAFFGL